MRTLTAAACGALLLASQLACGRRVDVSNLNGPGVAGSSRQQEAARARLKAQAEELARAFGGGDAAKLADLSHPTLFELAGGKEHLIEDITESVRAMREEGLEYEAVVVGEPGRVAAAADGKQWFAVVPNEMRVKTPSGVAASRSYFLGISDDGGANWTFVDGADIENRDDLKSLFPSAPDDLSLPEQAQPALQEKQPAPEGKKP